MKNQRKPTHQDERARKIWLYYDITRLVLLILMIAGLYHLCIQ